MSQELKEKALALPLLPGVYLMKDQEGSIIYVGKSKELRRRVSSYFGDGKSHTKKVKRMVRQIYNFDIIYTDTELDALLLECKLIKEIKPIYNRLLKDDSKYRYIRLIHEGSVPYLNVSYEKEEGDECYGPYNQRNSLVKAVEILNSYYKLPSCEGRHQSSCCIQLLRKQCLAPCEGQISNEVIEQQLEAVRAFLSGRDVRILKDYKQKVAEAAESLDFEKAATYQEAYEVLNLLDDKNEATRLALGGQKAILTLDKPTGGRKVYFLVGLEIVGTVILEDKEELEEIRHYFKGEYNIKESMSKGEIDPCYIIYQYSRDHKKCEYKVIGI